MPRTPSRRLEYLPIDEIQPATENPKRHASDAITVSIQAFGYVEPMVLDERTGRLVVGHGRLESLRSSRDAGQEPPEGVTVRNGVWLAPVLRGWASRSDGDARALLLASNRLVELGGWDEAELATMLGELDEQLLETAGWSETDLADLLAGLADAETPEARTEPDDAPPLPKKAVTRLGDLWELGPHRLLCGDATAPDAYAALLGDERVSLVWTDPPYGVGHVGGDTIQTPDARRRAGGQELSGDDETAPALFEAATPLIVSVTRPGSAWYVTGPSGPALLGYVQTLVTHGIHRQTLVWVKDQLVPGRSDYHQRHEFIFYGWTPGAAHQPPPDRTQDTVWEVPRPRRSEEHPTMKPVELIARALVNSSKPRALVLDPFAGSGSTLIACHQTNRRARLIEIDPRYCDVICRRFEEHTAHVPTRAGKPHSFIQKAP